jgi:3-hydroxybutyryl-CoA dehydratase
MDKEFRRRRDAMSFTAAHLYFDDVQIGQEWESLGRTVTEADIVNFAGISGDFNPIHMDHEFAKNTVFRKPIAHGLLILSIASGLGVTCPPMRTLAFISIKDWKFFEPVFIGDTIRVRARLVEKEERSRGRRGVVTWHRQIVNQHNKTTEEGFIVTLVEGRGIRNQESGIRSQESGIRSQESGIRDQESETA